MRTEFDCIVIGAGAAGITAAKTAAGFKKTVALIESNLIGGECTWTGCVPSKALIKAAEVAHTVRRSQTWGVTCSGMADTSGVMEYVRSCIQKVYATTQPELFESLGITLFFHKPQFLDAYRIQLDDGTVLVGKKIVICTGSRPFVPDFVLDHVPHMTNETFFSQQILPESLLILGGGPIGVEMASACNRLGVKVDLIEMHDQILPKEDNEMALLVADTMRQEGVSMHLGHTVTAVAQKDNGVAVTVVSEDGEKTLWSSCLLVAVGRAPNIEGLALERAGVKWTQKGIVVDRYLRTSVGHIFACGDVVGPYQFSHMAWHQAVVAVRNAYIPFFKRAIDYTHVIWVTFSAPECASAGMTEQQAIDTFGKKDVIIYKKSYAELDRAMTDGTQHGLIKVITHKGSIVGVHIVGARAGDIIHEAQLAKWYNIPLHALQQVIHAYPTYAELLWHIAKQAYIDRLMHNRFLNMMRRLLRM